MFPNAKLSDVAGIITAIDPVSTSTTVTSAWVPVADFHSFMALVDAGVFGASATVDAKLHHPPVAYP